MKNGKWKMESVRTGSGSDWAIGAETPAQGREKNGGTVGQRFRAVKQDLRVRHSGLERCGTVGTRWNGWNAVERVTRNGKWPLFSIIYVVLCPLGQVRRFIKNYEGLLRLIKSGIISSHFGEICLRRPGHTIVLTFVSA